MGKEKPLPYRQLFIICACRFAEPICFTVIFPFILFMIRDFNLTDEKHLGYYVGFITSAFAVAQLLTGIHWGMLSDRIGRRPVILFGLFGTLSSILLFGLSKNFAWALFSRSLCGLLNGNVSVLKSMVSEITIEHSPEQRARAFSFLPLMFGIGSILGPMLGGLLSNPVETYPSIFGRGGPLTDFFTEFPYFLPCFVSAVICALGLIFGIFFLEETLESAKPTTQDPPTKVFHELEEERPLIQHNEDYNTFNGTTTDDSDRRSTTSPTPTLPDQSPAPSFRESLTPAVLAICLAYALFSFQAIFYDELFPIWTASKRENGGLGFQSDEIGIALAYCGCVTLFVQLLLLPAWTRWFGQLRLFQIVLFGCIFLYLGQGFTRYMYNIPDPSGHTQTKFWVWVGLILTSTLKTMFHTTAFTSCTILTNDAAPRLDCLGAVNGFAQCCASGMRAFGPATCGAIWSASLGAEWIPYPIRIHISWITLSIVGVVTFYSSTKLNPVDYDTSKFLREEQVFPPPEDEEDMNRRA
ncbi:major facilitator superfamily domain-containing protein [Zychaea mexicana]|uniref:major facilitator superfamily domain-containing protein n=1 Tax=Zychaea mexicana TaxID=64656 RepID=UPI0022FDFC26|nr:major facilitator superfamily domain-containing protein [Zychaea mexicana]KAI9488261.1 major facilitator superfamily domain-containing protein [Zychaea mexicana]